MNRLRVLACVFACFPPGKPGFGGGEDLLGWNLLNQIARYHEVWALTREENRESIEAVLADQPAPHIHFCYLTLPRWLSPLLKIQGGHQLYYHLWQFRAYFAARRLNKAHRFDLFHHITYANDWLANFIGTLLPVGYVRGPGGGAHRTPKALLGEYTLGGRIWEKVRSVGQWVFRHDPFFTAGQNRAAALLVCNEEARLQIPIKWSDKVHWFPVSGVSTEDLCRISPPPTDDGFFRVISAGSLIRVKGFGLSIRAFAEFANQHPDAHLDIVGTGPEEPRLRALVHHLKMEKQVHLLGWMERKKLLSHMSKQDVFLFPSMRDGGGTVVIEAMSLEKPVVCLDAGGPGTHITEECGIKVPPHSPGQAVHDMAKALETLCHDRELRLNMGKKGKARAAEFYHWDRLGERLMKIYETTTAGHN